MERTEAIGVSDNRYIFEVYSIWTQFRSLPGIYMFLSPSSSSQSQCSLDQSLDIWNILYIGETDDFNRRLYQQLRQHHKYQYVIQKGATHIGVCALNSHDERKRKWVESDLINYYIPPGNSIL